MQTSKESAMHSRKSGARALASALGLALLAAACSAPTADPVAARTGALAGAGRAAAAETADAPGPGLLAAHERALEGSTLPPPADEIWLEHGHDEAVPPSYLAAAADVVLDRRDDGAVLVGRPERALAEADPERVLVLAATDADGRPLDAALAGARVLDARFAGDAVVTLGADHVLRAHRAARVTVLDQGAEAPLSVSGTRVAYARGEMPSFELGRADVATGIAETLTSAMAPVWSPALSPDGREIVFVSGVTGSPRLYRIGEDDSATPLAEVGVFPSSLRAPRWDEAGTLTFEDEAGARHVLDLAAEELVP